MTRKKSSSTYLPARRFAVFFLAMCVILLLFSARLLHLTVILGNEMLRRGHDNFHRRLRIPAPRGIIVDRDGSTPLADNITSFDILFSPHNLNKRTIQQSLDNLAETLNLDRKALEKKLESLTWRGASFTVKNDCTLSSITPIMEQEQNFPGVYIQSNLQRHYPLGTGSAHIVGYVGAIPPDEISSYLEKGYVKTDKVGITGIEKTYERYLHGKDGYEIVVQNARGKVIDSAVEEPAQAGNTLITTIDSELQQFCWEEMKNLNGVAIVIQPQNGEILAMVSAPSFDPSKPLDSSSDREISHFHRAIQGTYAPGSTIKALFAIAALENGVPPERKISCSGKYFLPDWQKPFICNEGFGHGSMNLEDALQYSCNTYFYEMGQRLGGTTLVDYAHRFGLGRLTGIDLPFEKPGFLPLYDTSILTRGFLVQFSIGQGKIEVTPLQIAHAYSLIATNGRSPVPHLVRYIENDKGQVISKPGFERARVTILGEARRHTLAGMSKAVNESGGTAYRAQFKPSWKVAGKTGTAQNPRGNNDAWFVCFAPVDQPQILTLVMIEDGGHGGHTAAPIARNILDFYFETVLKKQ